MGCDCWWPGGCAQPTAGRSRSRVSWLIGSLAFKLSSSSCSLAWEGLQSKDHQQQQPQQQPHDNYWEPAISCYCSVVNFSHSILNVTAEPLMLLTHCLGWCWEGVLLLVGSRSLFLVSDSVGLVSASRAGLVPLRSAQNRQAWSACREEEALVCTFTLLTHFQATHLPARIIWQTLEASSTN